MTTRVMIKEKVYYTVACDKCGAEIPAEATSRRTARELAEANGWKTILTENNGAEKYLCPRCKSSKKT